MANPNESPVVSQPSLFRPTATVVGNREIRPSIIQWVRLFSIPTNPIDALNVYLQWLWSAYGSLAIASIAPLAVQVVIGFIWLFLMASWATLVIKDAVAKQDALWVALSISIGVLLSL